ncbi:MAG: ribonucleotide-diphosphate reductase subunit beta [Flavobacteriaceae bacterium]|jgi:ribonucleoside-diphosphate reductase beta chain|nr:ribonucleotide-diphosphate reductase subunit beta [Flavobacteriaceae bacterium]
MGIFDKRVNYKPFEYPEVMQFVDSMNSSFWVHKEIDFTADIQDFKSNLSGLEQEIIKRSLLSIAQVEIGVKLFWGDLYRHFPKPEFNNLGATFAECEVRHGEAYARLLEVLGYNKDFENLVNIPVFAKKIELIENSLYADNDIISKLLFFTIVIENSSLFSQFANILSFTRFKGYLKNTSNIIAWTSIDEQNHADAGVYLLNKLEQEGYLTEKIKNRMADDVKKYIGFESELLDWIYEYGELDFFSKEDMLNFMKHRVDESLLKIGIPKLFNITPRQYQPMLWFDEDVFANELDDFFAKRPTAYTKHDKSIHAEDLF